MKKILLFTALLVFGYTANAQDEDNDSGGVTAKGNWMIEANTGFGGGGGLWGHAANTGFGLTSIDGSTLWSIGGEAGYFLADDLALKVGLGFTDFDGENMFTYKLGAKYYIASQFPVQLDLTGASGDAIESDFGETPLWIGLQGGYAWFVADNISIEPGLRYNISMNEDYTDEGIFEFRIGFALYF